MKAEQDPKVKLTLSVKKSVIEKAKKYAGLSGSSVSTIVEDYLSHFSLEKDAKEQEFKDSIAFRLMGCAKDVPFRHMTDDEIKDMWVKDRYGL